VNWLLHAFYNRGGGILADDMGLGKTVQTLACLSWLRSSGNATSPFCVVCPLSCAGNWIRECKRFVPHLSVAKVCGAQAERDASLDNDEIWYGMTDIIVATYESMKSTEEFFQRHTWSVLVLDEAHRIKSQFSAVRQVLDTVPCSCRLLLTGTPLQNNLNELFELLRFLWPDVLAKESEVFQEAIQLPETCLESASRARLQDGYSEISAENVIDESMVSKVQTLLSTLMLRRLKVDVISLPPKTLHDVWVPLTPTQVSWYRALLNCRNEKPNLGVKDVFQMVTRLRLACAHPRCILSNESNIEKLSKFKSIDMPALQGLVDKGMCDEIIQQSGKLCFLDKLLGHLHAQNMGMSSDWRKNYEDRQSKSSDPQTQKKKSAAAWLKSSEGVLFLENMRPWKATRPVAFGSIAKLPESASGFAHVVGSGAHNGDSADVKAAPSPPTNGSTKAAPSPSADGNADDSEDEGDTPQPHKVLIFSQYHMCLDIVEQLCTMRGWRYLRLDGSTSRIMRELDMRDFNSHDEDYFVYIIGTRAGGLGINLFTANHVVLFDHDWNPHVDSQAIDRSHRIGQRRTVQIYRLISEWTVEERLVHRQEQKLKIEQCVVKKDKSQTDVKSDADEDPGFDAKERLSGQEVIQMLMHGEATLRRFPGENCEAKSLQEFLDRNRRPLLEAEVDNFEVGAELSNAVVEDDETIGARQNDVIESTVHTTSHNPVAKSLTEAIQSIETLPATHRVTRSGRIVRPVVQFAYQQATPTPKVKKKVLMKHDKVCFVCGLKSKPGSPLVTVDGADHGPDLECSVCPKAFHRDCLPLDAFDTKKGSMKWSCGWHHCKRCKRGLSTCGGILMTCQSCPSALCYDCFPPNFRRVSPEPRFWTDLQKKGWNVDAKKMIFFNCNSCLAMAEQRRKQLMKQEDLEAQLCARKKQALEEKRGFADRKRKRESEESRRRLRQVMAEHERAAMHKAMTEAKEEVRVNIDSLMSLKSLEAVSAKTKTTAFAPAALCMNCGFPGHRHAQCPMPLERVAEAASKAASAAPKHVDPDGQDGNDADDGNVTGAAEGDKKASKSKYSKRCAICKSLTHSRIQCPQLTPEQRREYENRITLLKQLACFVVEAKPFFETLLDASVLQNGEGDIQACVRSTIRRVLEPLDLEHLIIEPPAPLIAPKAKPLSVAKLAGSFIKKALPKMRNPLKPKFVSKAKLAPKLQGKASLKVGLNGSAKVKPRSQVPQMQNVTDGVAAGWKLLCSVDPKGVFQVKYKRPTDTQFHKKEIAFVAADKRVQAQLKLYADKMVARVRVAAQAKDRLGGQPDGTAEDESEERPAKSLRKTEAQPQVQTGDSMTAGQAHVHDFRYGPAVDWTMRIKITSCRGVPALQYSYRRPGSSRWENGSDIPNSKDPNDPAWQQILSTRDFVAKDIRSRMIATTPGISEAPVKRSAAEVSGTEEPAMRKQGQGPGPGRPKGPGRPSVSPTSVLQSPRTPSRSTTPPREQAQRQTMSRSPSVNIIERSPSVNVIE